MYLLIEIALRLSTQVPRGFRYLCCILKERQSVFLKLDDTILKKFFYKKMCKGIYKILRNRCFLEKAEEHSIFAE